MVCTIFVAGDLSYDYDTLLFMNLVVSDSTPAKCPLCNTLNPIAYTRGRVKGVVSYTLYGCSACTVEFWWPLKNPGASWYERDERYADRNADPILKPNEKHIGVMDFLKGKKAGRVLDVGCGVGNFLALAKERGWECWGIDFDKDAIAAGKRAYELENLSVADLAKFAHIHPELQFNLITFFDVFEHLDNHNEFLALVRNMLTPGGSIALSVPYRHGWRWLMPHDLPPRHLTRWDEHSLENIFSRHGFRIQMVRYVPASLYFIVLKLKSRYGMWTSFGLVKKMKAAEVRNVNEQFSYRKPPLRIRLVGLLAKAKDMLFFGTPALILWLMLLPTRKRYTDFYIVAGSDANSFQ
jgi:2-polyprenyl-3-methyl-5-hydroxy-6-metoxy-1,4-benzoquinol methylase